MEFLRPNQKFWCQPKVQSNQLNQRKQLKRQQLQYQKDYKNKRIRYFNNFKDIEWLENYISHSRRHCHNWNQIKTVRVNISNKMTSYAQCSWNHSKSNTLKVLEIIYGSKSFLLWYLFFEYIIWKKNI